MSSSRRWFFVSLVALAAGALACDSGSGPGVQPSSASVAGGDDQTAEVGQLVAQALAVLVTGTDERPFEGAEVEWEVVSGGGSVSPPVSLTGSNGVAITVWTLGTMAGEQSVRAAVQGAGSVTFTATAEPGEPDRVVVTPAEPTIDALDGMVALSADLQDEFGNSISGADFEWSSEDEAVATVDTETGVATGVAVGNTDVTATETGSALNGEVTLEVRQVAASIEVTPNDFEVPVGQTVQVNVVVRDANGHEIPDVLVAWNPQNPAVATVQGNNQVRGESEGTTTITASVGEASTEIEVDVILVPEDFEPAVDQEISGTLTVANLVVGAGVTLTATDDTEIRAFGDVTIEGTITGDCVQLSVIGTGDLTLSGLVENDCSAPGPDDQPDLLVQGGGAINVVGAEFGSSGGTTITNVPAAAAFVRAGGAATTPGPTPLAALRLANVAEGMDCSFADMLVRSTDQADGAAGSPQGSDGATGKPQVVACAGTARFEGPGNTGIFGHDAGTGGNGTSNTSGVAGVGGNGGVGADAIVMAGGDVVIDDVFLILQGGDGGRGGNGIGESYPLAEGNGGNGGRPGLGKVIVGGELRTEGTGELDIEVGGPGSGGTGVGTGMDGDDATSTTPAQPGGDAMARGGDGANWGGETGVNLIGDMIEGAVAAGANINPRGATIFAPRGGGGVTEGGQGGDGSFEFPDGERGGNQTAVGGKGGDVNLFDNRAAPIPFADTEAGDGGDIFFQKAQGGDGADRCMVFPVMSGGMGGKGGDLTGATGEPGADGSGGEADPGDATYVQTSNGGAGGDGDGPGDGGPGGSDTFVIVEGALDVQDPSLQPGPDGNPCVTGFNVTIGVQSDPNEHEPFIMMTSVTMLDVMIDENGNISITSMSGIWIPVTGTIAGDGSFTATGSGTAAGFPNVPVSFTGTIQTDGEGNITGITGTLTVDSTNSVLPPNMDDERNPAIYTVGGTKKTGE